MNNLTINQYHFESCVSTLGPGKRAALWVQGCDFACAGCLVPDSHAHDAGQRVLVSELLERLITNSPGIEGITISGGEPFLQASALCDLLARVKQVMAGFSVMIFTGFKIEALQRCPHKRRLLEQADILVDGLFLQAQQVEDAWRGSSNQRIFFLTNRYSPGVYLQQPHNELEFIIKPGGGYMMVGIPSRHTLQQVETQLMQIGHYPQKETK